MGHWHVYFTLCNLWEYFSRSWFSTIIIYCGHQNATFSSHLFYSALFSSFQAPLEHSSWVRAKDARACSFFSEMAFPSDEVYLLSDRASEHCWCRDVNPRQWPHFHTPLHTMSSWVKSAPICALTYPLTFVYQAGLVPSHLHVATWKAENTSLCLSCSLAL